MTDAERQDAFENAVARIMAEAVRLAGECHPGCSYELRLVLGKLIARKAALLIEMLEERPKGGA